MKRNNVKQITIRLTADEYAHVKQLSKDSGLKMEPAIRRLIMGVNLRPPRLMNCRSCCVSFPASARISTKSLKSPMPPAMSARRIFKASWKCRRHCGGR